MYSAYVVKLKVENFIENLIYVHDFWLQRL